MFLRHSVHIQQSAESCRQELLQPPHRWLPGPIGPGVSRLTLSGTYGAPLGALGREIDTAVLHRVAEATIRNFAEGIAARVSKLAGSRSAP